MWQEKSSIYSYSASEAMPPSEYVCGHKVHIALNLTKNKDEEEYDQLQVYHMQLYAPT